MGALVHQARFEIPWESSFERSAEYAGDPLAQFRAELVDQLALEDGAATALPPLPATGELDLQTILQARYMFA